MDAPPTGIHDMGGRTERFGPIPVERGEPVFHADWERRVFGVAVLLLAIRTNMDAMRASMERLAPERYLALPYYGRWLAALEEKVRAEGFARPVAEAGLRDRLAAPLMGRAVRFILRPLPWIVCRLYPIFLGFARPTARPAAFRPGDRVRARVPGREGHTRLPGYLARKVGTIHRHHGAMIYPDAHAAGRGEQPQHTYSVRFEGTELWGPDAEPGTEVFADLFEPYLERAP
ncbi:MAG: nitrile hydratase subunit beta [Myxococcales bacterium]|nr:nitrile hydratase subunit beta [Myxococcales bacterium]